MILDNGLLVSATLYKTAPGFLGHNCMMADTASNSNAYQSFVWGRGFVYARNNQLYSLRHMWTVWNASWALVLHIPPLWFWSATFRSCIFSRRFSDGTLVTKHGNDSVMLYCTWW